MHANATLHLTGVVEHLRPDRRYRFLEEWLGGHRVEACAQPRRRDADGALGREGGPSCGRHPQGRDRGPVLGRDVNAVEGIRYFSLHAARGSIVVHGALKSFHPAVHGTKRYSVIVPSGFGK